MQADSGLVQAERECSLISNKVACRSVCVPTRLLWEHLWPMIGHVRLETSRLVLASGWWG